MRQVILILVFLGLSLAKDFSGDLVMQYKSPGGNGEVNLKVSEHGAQIKLQTQVGKAGMPLSMEFIMKASDPGNVVQLNHAQKSYSIIDLNSLPQPASLPKADDYKLTKKGKSKLLGYDVVQYTMSKEGEIQDFWVAPELTMTGFYKQMEKAMASQNSAFSTMGILQQKGVMGLPLKTVIKDKGGRTSVEIAKLTPKKYGAKDFEVPAGYKKGASLTDLMKKMQSGQMPSPEEMEAIMKQLQK